MHPPERLRIPTLQLVDIELPEEFEALYDLAYNLWWTWSSEARHLFANIEITSWARYHNPVELLLNTDRQRWETLADSDTFQAAYGKVTRDLGAYLAGNGGTWFSSACPEFEGGPIAYVSMEYGIHQAMAIYSGGLGVLSGDHCKSASDLGLPFVAVGLLYRSGYFRQTVDADGFQQHNYPELDFQRLPLRPALDARGRRVVVRVPLPGREVAVQVWVAQVGRVPLLLLDTDLPDNEPSDRPITGVLYVRGREMRLVQEMVLGVGAARALAALGIEPSVWHMNEGHSALLQLERLRREVAAGTDFEDALGRIGRRVAFTTHTPVEAGNESFDRGLATPYLETWAPLVGADTGRLLRLGEADHGEPNQRFNLTALALRTSAFANGVSRIHAEVADNMWRHLFDGLPDDEPAVQAITNGVHMPTWLGLEMRELLAREIGKDWLRALLEEDGWRAVLDIDDDELWAAHRAQKERLGRFTRSRLRDQSARHGRSPAELRAIGEMFGDEALTVGFARRFATYKRSGLIFHDLHRLRHLLRNPARPVRIFLAGKAHPADRPGQDLVRHIFKLSREHDLRGHVVFLENYDMRVARMLVQGADVWLNTPRPPMEASGTSGQKAGANGVLNLSIADGWWPEAYDGDNGWIFGSGEGHGDEAQRDERDALALYQILEEEVVPAYYERDEAGLPRAWIARMKRSIATIGPRFSSDRMVRDYVEEAYLPLAGDAASFPLKHHHDE